MTSKLLVGRMKSNYSPNDDIYTPPELFNLLKLEFDLDVCAPKGGLDWIPAKNHYSLKDDGLLQDWYGLVWCNPPYSNPKPWVDKFIDHRNGIMLAPLSKSNWFIKLWNYADAISLRGSNWHFIKNEKKHSIFTPTALFGMGEISTKALIESGLGRVR